MARRRALQREHANLHLGASSIACSHGARFRLYGHGPTDENHPPGRQPKADRLGGRGPSGLALCAESGKHSMLTQDDVAYGKLTTTL